MANSQAANDRELALSFITSDSRDAYNRYRVTKLFLRNPEALDSAVAALERKYGKKLQALQAKVYSTRDLNAFVRLPSPETPVLPRLALVREVREDLLEFAGFCDELLARELLPEYGARIMKEKEKRVL